VQKEKRSNQVEKKKRKINLEKNQKRERKSLEIS
jgi:hypothetical protein